MAAELISARLDGEMTAAEAGALAAHLDACSTCRRRADDMAVLNRRLSLRAAEPVPDLTDRILAGVTPARAARGLGRRLALAAAAALVVLAGTVGTLALVGGPRRASDDGTLAVGEVVTPDPLGSSAVVYLTIRNPGSDDRLVSASSPVASSIGLHVVSHYSGMATMRATEAFLCSSRLVLGPTSSHLMLSGLRGELDPGDRFPLTLHFERSQPVVVDVEVVRWADLEDRVSLLA